MIKHHPRPLLRKLNKLYQVVSHPFSFLFLIFTLIGWFIVGYMFHFDETWYKAFHIFEIVIALTMIFLIENSTHTDSAAMQEKLDEIIRSIPKANDNRIGLEKHLKGEIRK